MLYDKRAFSVEEQITQLEDRGLEIPDKAFAKHHLLNKGYYRLAGYWWSMQSDKEKHIFREGNSFENVIALYDFDQELRLLLFDVIEKIEISLRTKLIYYCSHAHGPWWFQDTTLFSDIPSLIKTLHTIEEEVCRSKDAFIKEHKKKYNEDKRFPPSWKTLELTSLGNLSKLYGNLKNNLAVKDTIAEDFYAVNHTYLPSWLQSITQIRNYCAHHSRLWNKNLPGAPRLLTNPPKAWVKDIPKQHEFQKLYVHLCIMKYLLNTIQPDNKFSGRLITLFEKFPTVDPNALGMKEGWQHEELWH